MDSIINNILKFIIALFLVGILVCIGIHYAEIVVGYHLRPEYLQPGNQACANVKKYDLKIQDFITIITGLLALIVGATSVGSYISFKKILKEEEKITHLREKFEALLIISESSAFDPVTATGDQNAVKIYSAAEKKCREYGLLYVLRGEQYYYSNDFESAIKDFEKAVGIDPTLARAWFGWGQALFKSRSIAINVCKSKKIWDFNRFKSECRRLEMHKINLKISPHMAKDSLEKMNKAKNYGYDESKINFEIGRIYEAMKNTRYDSATFDEILSKYHESYKNGNSDAGLYYCVAWIRQNCSLIFSSSFGKDVEKVIEILADIAIGINKSMAYALWCYLSCARGDDARAERLFQETNDLAINELFYLKAEDSEGDSCSSSPA